MNYSIKINHRAKRISITVKRDGSCTVSVPFRRSAILQKLLIVKAESFVRAKDKWIEAQREKYIKIQEKINKGRVLRDANLNVKDIVTKNTGKFDLLKYSEKYLKKRTMDIVMERLFYFNKFYNFEYKQVRVKKVSSRWGSCSHRGNLNFSHKLALLHPEEIDYVVVHELCHLREFNHGPKFWELVEQTIPNYKQIREGMSFAIF